MGLDDGGPFGLTALRGTAALVAVITAAALVASCSDNRSSSAEPSTSPETSTTREEPLPNTTIENVDLRALPVSEVSVAGRGEPPAIAWTEPTDRWQTVHVGDAIFEVPRPLTATYPLGEGFLLRGGCPDASRCRHIPRGEIHLLDTDGTLTSLDVEEGPHGIYDLAVAADGTEAAWLSYGEIMTERRLWHLEPGQPVATEVVNLVPSEGNTLRLVGIIGPDDLLVAEEDDIGRPTRWIRSSGGPTGWGLREISFVADGLLLGEPTHTPRRDMCLARFASDSTSPVWTRCYRWGKQPVAVTTYGVSSSDGSLLVSQRRNEVVLLDGRTGEPISRGRFRDTLIEARAEDGSHFLAVLTRGEKLSWMVRCDLDLKCEMATDRYVHYQAVAFIRPH